MHNPKDFILKCQEAINSSNFNKISLGNYKGSQKELKNCYIKPVIIKHKLMLSFTYRFQTKDIFKNYAIAEGFEILQEKLLPDFHSANLFTNDSQTTLILTKQHKYKLTNTAIQSEMKQQPINGNSEYLMPKNNNLNRNNNYSHDRIKSKDISTNAKYLIDLGLSNEKGEIFKNAQDKFKQINHYIKLLKPVIAEVGESQINNIADMGSGKGYLTFALYDYLIKNNPDIILKGIEYRQDLVDFCNQIASKYKYKGLIFEQGTIIQSTLEQCDMVIALHACDTATDEAIYKGINAKAKLIVVAPCCHKQIRREMEKNTQNHHIQFITKQGIFLERQAEMLTDATRILLLELSGYKTKTLEFISDSHTPKNVMIIASWKGKPEHAKKQEILEKLKNAKSFYGFTKHHLEELLSK